MKPRLRPIAAFSLLTLAALSLAQSLPSTAPDIKATHFTRGLSDIESLEIVAPGKGFIAASKAIYAQDGDIFHWRAVDSLVSSDLCQLAGGDADHLFFTRTVDMEKGTARLLVWSRATGRTSDLGITYDRGGCQFVSATRGAVIAQQNPIFGEPTDILLTSDAAKTWTRYPNILGPKKAVRCLLWLSPDRLLVGGSGSAVCCKINAQGVLEPQWSTPITNSEIRHASLGAADAVWVATDGSAVKLDGATGKILADIQPRFPFEIVGEFGADLWIAGEINAAVYRADAGGKYSLVKKFGYPGPSGGSSFNNGVEIKEPPGGWVQWIVADKDGHAVLVGIDGQTYQWDGKGDSLSTTPLIIDNTAVAAAEAATAATQPSLDQFRELGLYFDKVDNDRLGDLMAAAKEKQKAEKWNERQRVAWMLAEMKKIVDSDAKNGPPAPRTATGRFDSSVFAIRFFSPTSGLAITHQGIATTDGGLDRWKGLMGWETPPGDLLLVGGSEDQLFFVNTAFKEIVVKEGFDLPPGMENDRSLQRVTKGGKDVLIRVEYTLALLRWTRDAAGGKIVELRKLPHGTSYESTPAPCDFVTAKIGAFVDGQTLKITRDAGVTWTDTKLTIDPPGRSSPGGVNQIAFCNENQLVIDCGMETIALLTIDKDGNAHEDWRKRIYRQLGDFAVDLQNKFVWVYSENGQGTRMQALNLADGSLAREFNPFAKDEILISYSVVGNQMITLGQGLLRLWDLSANPPKQTAEISGAINAAYPMPNKGPLILLLDHRQLIEWNGKPEIPRLLTSDIRRPFIDNTLLSAAEDRWPPGDEASRAESKALMDANRALTIAQQRQLNDEVQTKRNEFENQRAQVLWMTQRALQMKAATTKP